LLSITGSGVLYARTTGLPASLLPAEPQQAVLLTEPQQPSADTLQMIKTMTDSVITVADSVITVVTDTVYKPDPAKAIWYSALFPGLGQLYTRRYWKLPVIAAGVAAIAYAINWNSKYYVAYTNAYRDISDDNPNTTSYLKLLPSGSYSYSTSQLTTVLENRQQKYRRSRDLSYIGAVGIYLICILDAYVDAQLYDFDVSPDLSLHQTPLMSAPGGAKSLELSLSFRF